MMTQTAFEKHVVDSLGRIEEALKHHAETLVVHSDEINGRPGNGLGIKGRIGNVETWRGEHEKHHGRLNKAFWSVVGAIVLIAGAVITPVVTAVIRTVSHPAAEVQQETQVGRR